MPALELVLLLIFIAVKFAMSFPLIAVKYDFGFIQTVLLTSAGGISGVLVFSLVTAVFSKIWDKYYKGSMLNIKLSESFRSLFPKRNKKKKVFTRRNKIIIKIRKQYGLIGLAMLTPTILSIPLGTFITLRYYPNYIKSIAILCGSVILWSVIFTLCFIFL
ncbi:MAG: hypothetical protein Kow0068_16450 [Marinilabiliales bacterium]